MQAPSIHFRRALILPVVVFSIVGLALSFFWFTQVQDQRIYKAINDESDTIQQQWERVVVQESKMYRGLLEFLSADSQFQQIWQTENHIALSQHMTKRLQLLRDYRASEFTAYTPDRVVKFRAHKEDHFGDQLSHQTLMNAEVSGEVSWGIELEPSGQFVLKVVAPWYINGRLSGYLEIGEKLEYINQSLREIYSHTGVITIPKRLLSREHWNVDSVYGWEQLVKAVIVTANGPIFEQQSQMPDGLIKIMEAHPNQRLESFEFTHQDRIFYGKAVAIKDKTGTVAGHYYLALDVSEYVGRDRRNAITFLAIVAGAVIIMITLFSFWVARIQARLTKTYSDLENEVAKHKKAQLKLHHYAYYDALTQLPNRALFLDRLQIAVADSQRTNRHSGVLFLDIDNFKDINDSLGHATGDLVLKAVARILSKATRKMDTVSRFSGDEFLILAINLGDNSHDAILGAESIANKLFSLLRQPLVVENRSFDISVSIGISIFPFHAENSSDLLRFSDAAMYEAKRDGKNRFRVFEATMHDQLQHRLALEQDIHEALDQSQFQLYYQPKVNSEHQLCGAEALIRWQHPQKGMIAPDQFIPVAEQSGQISKIGQFVMTQAAIQYKQWQDDGLLPDYFKLAINISPLQFRQPNFVESVKAIVEQTNSGWLILEITEGVLIEDISDARDKLSKLKALDVEISIDDFGTGYSSLAYLSELQVDELKIDRSFVQQLGLDGNGRETNSTSIVKALLHMSNLLSIRTVAEGVETQEQLRLLTENNCPCFQGYWFGRPVNADEFSSALVQVQQKTQETEIAQA